MKIIPVEQGSTDWSIARSGIPTASEFDNLLTPEFKVRTGEMPKTYLVKKLAEAWCGGPIASLNSFDVEQGHLLEEEARKFFDLNTDTPVTLAGLCTTDDGRIGCSPDGLIGDDGGLELKCPALHTHVGYLLNGTLPKDYACQVHGSLFVTGRKWWKFMSYRRNLPPLILTIERNDVIQEQIAKALESFLKDFDAAMARLIEINGGPPRNKKPVFAPAPSKPVICPEDDYPH